MAAIPLALRGYRPPRLRPTGNQSSPSASPPNTTSASATGSLEPDELRAMVAPVLAAPPRLRMAARAAFPTATPRSGACWRARGNGANLIRLPSGAIEGGWHGLEARGRGYPGVRCRSGQAVLQRAAWLQRRRRQPDGGVLSERPADAARARRARSPSAPGSRQACNWSWATSRPLEPNWLGGVLRSARSSTLRRVSGWRGPADRGTRSCSSRIPTATTGPCRKSPWPHERSAAPANHSRVVVQPRTSRESGGMTVHEFDAVVGGGQGRLPLVELPFDVTAAYGTARPKVKATVNDVTLRTTVSVYGGRSYVGFRKQIQEAAGIRIGDRVRVRIEPDTEPRELEVPDDLAQALRKDRAASQAFEGLSYTHRKEYAQWVQDAKKPETRQRRVEQTIELLRAGTKHP